MDIKKSLFAFGVGIAALCAVAAVNSAHAHECTQELPECHEPTDQEREAAKRKALEEYRKKMVEQQNERMKQAQ